jgi:hypothetical protein
MVNRPGPTRKPSESGALGLSSNNGPGTPIPSPVNQQAPAVIAVTAGHAHSGRYPMGSFTPKGNAAEPSYGDSGKRSVWKRFAGPGSPRLVLTNVATAAIREHDVGGVAPLRRPLLVSVKTQHCAWDWSVEAPTEPYDQQGSAPGIILPAARRQNNVRNR